MYVPIEYRCSKAEVEQLLSHIMNDDDYVADWQMLLRIDYAYHNQDNNYDGGLSFVDRIIGKLHLPQNAENLKSRIRDSMDPELEYVDVISQLLSSENDRIIYGL